MSSTSSKPKRGGGLRGPRPQPLSLSARPSKKPRVGGHAGPAAGPVIVYERTPTVVHADPHEFMAVVQRLTGNCKQRPSTAAMTLPPEATSGSGARDGRASTWTAADALVLRLGQQQRAPCGAHHPAPSASPAAASSPLLSPSSFFFSPTTMQAIRELIS
ncbi:hypothetical protein CFC21_063120 [Triticum aestivum]|uniref:VQ domain-containing protein n=3 Tax=Triticinae TaxID=1648030 RepID=A0A9R1GXV3_WHEAT|nr:protein MKS1-like [Aegilops tauschii subsp. strangulata]KAF7055611.1 hypothetical protein CFC21_063120 [Triticum aestivum]